jgi:hypothetical protein
MTAFSRDTKRSWLRAPVTKEAGDHHTQSRMASAYQSYTTAIVVGNGLSDDGVVPDDLGNDLIGTFR